LKKVRRDWADQEVVPARRMRRHDQRPRNLPNGTYDCICHAIKLRVSWITTASSERVPMLAVEPRSAE
jgi:hypothetical protein